MILKVSFHPDSNVVETRQRTLRSADLPEAVHTTLTLIFLKRGRQKRCDVEAENRSGGKNSKKCLEVDSSAEKEEAAN